MNPKQLYQWVRKTSKRWTGFTRHFQENVAVFTTGVARAQSSQIRKIAGCGGGCADSQRRRLQRFVGQALDMDAFFTAWTGSVMAAFGKHQREIVLIVDETKLKDRFGVMVVGMAYQGRCIPLAWRVYLANDPAAYPVEGQVQMILNLLAAVQSGIKRRTKVRVLADRGIGTSPDLMRGIMAMRWTFLFRVTKQSKIVLANGEAVTFYDQVHQPGQSYAASGKVFKKRGRVPAHVRVLWGEEAQQRWALVTNDVQLTGWEYAQRMWVEEAFRDLKSHGWQVEQTTFTCPTRMAHLWILLVVAYTWLLLWGMTLEVCGATLAPKRCPDGSRVRRWSLFREGWLAFLANPPPLF